MATNSPSREDATNPTQAISRITASVGGFIRGKAEVIDLAVTCLLAEGHLLLDDVPGVGKTSLARAKPD